MTTVPGLDVRVEHVPWDDPEVAALRVAQQAELRERYGDDDIGHAMTGEQVVVMVLLRLDGEPVACGALRDASDELGPGTGELKRMYVRPVTRGRGLSRVVLSELEQVATARGTTRLVLETGVLQPEAIGLYLGAGYRPVENYGEYVGVGDSRCFAKDLLASPAPPRPARVPSGDVTVARVDWDAREAVALRWAMVDELVPLYPEMSLGDPGGRERTDARLGAGALATFVAHLDGAPVAHAALVDAAAWGAGTGELKRLYVAPAARGHGVARRLVGYVEQAAAGLGLSRVVLDTGIRQPEAIALYRSLGYRPVRPGGDWSALPLSLLLGRDLTP